MLWMEFPSSSQATAPKITSKTSSKFASAKMFRSRVIRLFASEGSDLITSFAMALPDGGQTWFSSLTSSRYSGKEFMPLMTMTGVGASAAANAGVTQANASSRLRSSASSLDNVCFIR